MGNTVNLSGLSTPTRLKAKKAIFHISAPQSNTLKLEVAHTVQDYSFLFLPARLRQLFFSIYFYFFICLCQVFVVARGIFDFHCGTQDLVS